MSNGLRLIVGTAATGWLVSTLLVASTSTPSTAQQASGKTEDPATPLFARMCTDCHDAAPILSMRRTRTDWEDVLKKMIEKGADGTEKEFETVFDYLVRTYGKVHINTSKPDEIAAVLGLSQQDVDAIVAFRKEHGPFADFDALKKVPGIDVKKLEERKDAVAF